MADNYKILAQTTAASIEEVSGENQANVVYSVPANTQAAISSVSLINSSETSENYYLGVVKAEDVNTSASQQILDTFIAYAGGSTSSYSNDGISWEPIENPFNSVNSTFYQFQSIAYGDGKFVAFANGGFALYSTDGITWTLGTSWTGGPLASVVYGTDRFVGVNAFGTNLAGYSLDGINWYQSSLPYSAIWGLVYGNNKFVAFADGASSAAYSTDGITWTQISLSTAQGWRSGASTDNKFVIIAPFSSTAVYSEDGISWTQTSLPSSDYRSVAYGNGKFVAIGTGNNAAYSEDGVSWTQTSMPENASWRYIVFGGGKFVAISGFSNVGAYSTDGIVWTQTTPVSEFSQFSVLGYGGISFLQNTISDAQTIIPTRSIEPNTVDEITGGITLSAGDQIRVYSESTDLIVQVYGVEIA